jgi:hypothetical protein
MTSSRKSRPVASHQPTSDTVDPASMDSQIREFLAGETNGKSVLEALYDRVLGEPVPQRLKDLLRK